MVLSGTLKSRRGPEVVQWVEDMHLDQDQPARAMDALDRPLVWAAREKQSLARLAAAALRLPDHPPSFRFHKAVCLAQYLESHGDSRLAAYREIPFPGAIWDHEKLDDTAARARAWLEDEERQPVRPG